MSEKQQRGGAREGAGRPALEEKREVYAYRLFKHEKKEVDIFVNNLKKVIRNSK